MKQQILNATHGGLDVILSYYPDAEHCIGTNKHFKMRPGESDASACIKEIKGVWYVTDFGAESKAKNCFDIVMAEEGITFSKAIYFIADRFRVDIGFKAEINKPTKDFKTVSADVKVGFVEAVEKEDPYSDSSVLGAMVTPDVMRRYNIKSLKSYSKVFKKDNGTKCQVTISSNENFPIFMLDYGTWQKIYAPMAYDKKDRFFYVGEKPHDHVFFGLKQLQDVHAKLVQQEPINEKEPPKTTKLDYVFICAGERDALNCIGMGYTAVWMNSETAELHEKDVNLLYRYAEKVINIPDIDSTGMRMGIKRALEHWRLYTLLLPDWITKYKDRRGFARKDLTDFCELSSRQEFDKLVGTALQCQFWEKTLKKKSISYEINTISLLWFLRCHGFARIQDKGSTNERYVRIEGYKVSEYRPKEIRAFVKQQLREHAISVEIQRLYQDSKKTTAALCDDLPLVKIDLDKSDHQSRIMYFENTAVKVSANGIETISTKDSTKHCWEKAIAPHRFKRTTPAFTLSDDNCFVVQHTQSKLFASLVNASRMYWRQEFEERATGNADEDARYLLEHKFSVYGPRLTADEQHEQLLHLANKCYAIGYMLHQFKFESKPMAVWIMENKLTEDGESSGGSGKSFLINAIKRLNLLSVVTLQGREKGLTENKHLLDRVSCWTDILLIDDPRQYFDFDTFYSLITGNTTINRKGIDSYEIDYHDSPISVFASNFPPIGAKQGSTERRLLYVVYSDYYHAQGTQYREFRSIADDFGKDLFGFNYTEDEYNADYNFCVDCLQLYLRCNANGEVVRPPMENVYKRINISEMGNSGFLEWAELIFAPGSEYLDTLISRKEIFENFRDETGNRTWSQQKFKKALAAFCENAEHIIRLDPEELRKGAKRITRKVNGVQREYFYIQTKDEVNETIKSSWC